MAFKNVSHAWMQLTGSDSYTLENLHSEGFELLLNNNFFAYYELIGFIYNQLSNNNNKFIVLFTNIIKTLEFKTF